MFTVRTEWNNKNNFGDFFSSIFHIHIITIFGFCSSCFWYASFSSFLSFFFIPSNSFTCLSSSTLFRPGTASYMWIKKPKQKGIEEKLSFGWSENQWTGKINYLSINNSIWKNIICRESFPLPRFRFPYENPSEFPRWKYVENSGCIGHRQKL